MRFLNRWVEPLYALLRVVAGVLFAFHGAQKLFGAFGGQVAGEPLMILAGIIELGGGLLIAVGLLTSIAAFIASGEMAVAYFMVHVPQGLWPVEQGGGELAILYCFLFLYVAARGAGAFSLGGRFGKRKA